jgi:hypothetical protein
MNQHYQFCKPNFRLLGILFGGLLIGIPAIPQISVAQQTTPKVNPCPRIFYEEPHNNQVVVPEGCPPNAYTQRLGVGGGVDTDTTLERETSIQPQGSSVNPQVVPSIETRQKPIAIVTPATVGRVNVRLKNDTNTRITYQAIGQTAPRVLRQGEEFLLRDLPTPITITVVRQDNGFLQFTPVSSSDGTLVVSLDETTKFGDNQGALLIQEDGEVFLN